MSAGQAAMLRADLAKGPIVTAPGVFDGLSALIAEQSGFQAAYLSGASIAYTRLGRSDVGLVTMTEVAEILASISDRVEIAIVVDADTGFGNALNVQRTVRLFERNGAAAIQIEDQTSPKRCGHLEGKTLISTAEMTGKLKAALDARRDEATMIIARTDAVAVEGLEAALERAERYREAGADMLFVEAPRSRNEMAAVCQRLGKRTPLMANMVEGGATPLLDANELAALGYSLVVIPGGLARALAHMAQEYFASLRRHGATAPFRERMLDFNGLNKLIGTPDLLETGRRYDASNFEDEN